MSDRLTLSATFSILAMALYALMEASAGSALPDVGSVPTLFEASMPATDFAPGKLLPSFLR